jgi:transposase
MMIKQIRANCAGIDIGSEYIFVSVMGHEVTKFATMTEDYESLVKFFKELHVESVAMEATGVYWYTLYEMLDSAGFEVFLVNGAHTKNVPGRKSDVQDCQWLMELHAFGLLRKSFIPEDEIRQLRVYTRLRDDHIRSAAAHTQHIQKALNSMNIRLHQVISEITGVSGMKVLKAILAGERSETKLLALCDKQIVKRKSEQVVRSLKGYYKAEHLFALQQAVDGYEFYERQRLACDKMIEAQLQKINEHLPPLSDCHTVSQPKPARHNHPKINDLHALLIRANHGRDAATISALSDKTVLDLMAEVGTNMQPWPSSDHFTSWLGLCPRTDQTGKTRRRRKNRAKTNAGQIFKEAAMSVAGSKYLALGGFYRRIKAKRGPAVAIMATARKLAVQYYNLIKHGIDFVENGLQKYEERQKQRLEQFVMKKAQELGFQLINPATGELVH